MAGAASSPGLQWIAPFAGFTMAEYFRDRGQHALVVIDDLTKHAASHREIALLTRQSPGREAYPGDVFYVHARLLERAAKLSKEKGGGSLTALPIAETDAGNLSAYIPTNLISITDGQIVLDAKLFYEGQKPAVDVGTSVSRVGGKTQAHALREAAETLRLDYAQFLELEMFTRFGGMPDTRVRDQLTRGARIRAILDQPQHAPLRLADEVALVLAVQSGLLDALPLPAVIAFRRGLRDALDRGAADAVRRSRRPARSTTRGSRRSARRSEQYVQTLARRRRPRRPSRHDRAPRGHQRAHRRHPPARRRGECDARHRRGARPAGPQSARRRRQLCGDDRGRHRAGPRVGPFRRTDALRVDRPGRRSCCSAPSRDLPAPSASACSMRSAPISPTSELFLIGTRGSAVAAERGVAAGWKSAMPSHSAGIPKLADRIAEALYARIATGEIDRLDAVFSQWQPGHGIHVERRRLFPFDMTQFPRSTDANAPLLNLAPEALLSELTADYLHAQLCNAALHAFAAENEARMEAMAAARNQIERQLAALRATQRHVRQEEITAEIIELAAGETASRAGHD